MPNCMVEEDDEEYLSECGTPDGCGGTCDECEPDDVCAQADYAEIGICFNPDEECPEFCEFEEAECGSVWAGFVWPDCECGECPADPCFDVCVDGTCQPSNPGPEEGDGIDNNCNGQIDEGYPDSDLDGEADCVETGQCYFIPGEGSDDDCDGFGDSVDCDPTDGEVYPGADELCDGVDNDCNGEVDEGYGPDYNGNGVPDACEGDQDEDGDGIMTPEDNWPFVPNPMQEDNDWDDMGDACDPDPDNDGCSDDVDCAPLDPDMCIYFDEWCDGKDNNCDGQVDEGFEDTDSDGEADCVDAVDDCLQAELTLYGSGVPIVSSERGSLLSAD